MRRTRDRRLIGLCAAALWTAAACAGASAPPPAAPQPDTATGAAAAAPQVNPDAQALASLQEQVETYVALHRKLESTLPSLPKEATPEQIDQHQRGLARLVREARPDAQPGDIFTPESRTVIRALMRQVFGGPDGARLKASVMDENPGRLSLGPNSRYPDSVPLSTVPPQVLAGLPTLPEELEFRFIGRTLILLDVHAHLIADLIENVIP